ncbi:RHS repeat domain-containing protein [Lewinella sp. LCG006]|uniref:RHS repeat domain-containing protein n=1 Tax=Lewinella sp. LCG006 TaxID=3231911 RepID=UPI003460E968
MAVISDRRFSLTGDEEDPRYRAYTINASEYYPFGLEMEGRKFNFSDYRFGFNGKEADSDDEWGSATHYDYGARIYNPSVGRWLSLDPLQEEYSSISPYTFVANTPILAKDPDGRKIIFPTYGKEQKDVFLGHFRRFFGSGVNVDIATNGEFILEKIGDLTHEQQIAYNVFNQWVESEETAYVKLRDSYAFFENYGSNELDALDFNAYGDAAEGRTFRRNIMGHYAHFFAEEFYKQAYLKLGENIADDSKSFLPAHTYALQQEAAITGGVSIDISVNATDINNPAILFGNFDKLGQLQSLYYQINSPGGRPRITSFGGVPEDFKLDWDEAHQNLLENLLKGEGTTIPLSESKKTEHEE